MIDQVYLLPDGSVPPEGRDGTCYLIHLDPPYKHAGHYLGWTSNLQARLAHHAAGSGSRLCRVAVANGSAIRLARVWINPGTPAQESMLKRNGGRKDMCPLCGITPRNFSSPARSQRPVTEGSTT